VKSKPTPPPSQPKTEIVSVGGKTATITRHDRQGYQSFRVRYWQDGKRKELTAPDLETARKRAKEALRNCESGAVHVLELDVKESANVAAAIEKLRRINVPLLECVTGFVAAHTALNGEGSILEAVNFYVANRQKREMPVIRVPALVDAFLAEKTRQGKSTAYMLDITRRLNAFKAACNAEVGTVSTGDIAMWLRSIGATGRNFNNYRSTICTLFSFARERGFLARDKKTEAELLSRANEKSSAIGIYTADEIRKILLSAPEELIPPIALGAFGGLRSTEVFRLDWKEIRLARGHIEILASKAKTAQRRLVPISDNLHAWLAPLAKDSGRVSPPYKAITNLARAISGTCEKAGIGSVSNGLRHSYASYRLAAVKSADQVALEMGNSPRKLFTNYRELVTTEDADMWFNVFPPERPTNIVPIGSQVAA